MENFFNNERMVKSILKWKTHVLIAVAAAIVVSAFISSPVVIKPKYKSVAKIYPINTQLYSKESESEQMLEDIRSSDIKFKMIEAFQLDKVYRLNRDAPLYQTYVFDKYDKNVSYKKTEYESVEIRVLDENPQRASDMVDSLIVFFHQLKQQQRNYKFLEQAYLAERDLKLKNAEIDSLQEIINHLSTEYGLLNYETQVEVATAGLMDAAARRGDTKPAKEMLENLQKKGFEFDRIHRQLKSFQRNADSLKVLYDYGISHGTKKITYSIVVEKPYPADKKSYPVRWLIVFLSTVATIIASVIAVVTIEYFRERSSAK
jgi:hypothetical protein